MTLVLAIAALIADWIAVAIRWLTARDDEARLVRRYR